MNPPGTLHPLAGHGATAVTAHPAGGELVPGETDGRWLPAMVVFADPTDGGASGDGPDARNLWQFLEALRVAGVERWWFLRRENGWHFHLDGIERSSAAAALEQLVRRRVLQRWSYAPSCPPQTVPELRAPSSAPLAAVVPCGGPNTSLHGASLLDALVDLHCADSAGVTTYLRQQHPLLAERHVAGVLGNQMCRAAGLDAIQTADLLGTLARQGAELDENALVRARGLTSLLGTLLRAPATQVLGTECGSTEWVTGLTRAAERLGAATGSRTTLRANGQAGRGGLLHGLLGRAMSAQWNRLGLSATDQTILAVALRDALRSKGQKR